MSEANINLRPLKQLYVSICNKIVSFVPPDDFDDVLVLRLDQLGDFVLWLDSAKEYRKFYHGKRITLLVNANWYDLAKSLPYWDDVIPLDTIKFRVNPIYRIKSLLMIRRKGFEIVICPRHSVKFTLEPPIVAISGAEQRIVCEGSFPIEKQNYFTRSIPMRPDVHELCRNADFLRGLGRKDFKSTVPKLNWSVNSDCHKYILVCPTSFRKRKEWPLKNFEELVAKIKSMRNDVYICGDKKIDFDTVYDTSNFTGKTEIKTFIDMIANAYLIIANDSAPIHLASAFNVPSICIGAENPGRFLPYTIEKNREGMVLPKLIYKKNVQDITVDEVWSVVKELI